MKKTVAVFFGGRSPEHDISIITGVQALNSVDSETYTVTPIYLKNGAFYNGGFCEISDFTPFEPKKYTRLYLIDGVFYTKFKSIYIKKFKPDCALICCHGGEGENGVLQGLLEYNGISYSGCGVLASAIGMDKTWQKDLFECSLYNVVKHLSFSKQDFFADKKKILTHVKTYLEYPMIVKPNSLGSSIGIKCVDTDEDLLEAVAAAFVFDNKVIVEAALTDFTELNCAAFRRNKKVVVSEVEKPLSLSQVLTFDEKYVGGGKGMEGCGRELPANISAEVNKMVLDLTEKIYNDFSLSGVVRVDYLLDNGTGKLYVNEINTIPGSMAAYLFEGKGISFSQLLSAVIEEAFFSCEQKKQLKLCFGSVVLKNIGGNKTFKGI